jgi:hypothetical protein
MENTPYKSLLNGPFNVILVETSERSQRDDKYLVRTILPYLEVFQFSKLNIPTFGEGNPFGSMRHISLNDPQYKTLFQVCNSRYDVSYYTITKT